MGQAVYKIVEVKDGWGVSHEGAISGSYSTREAAFEAAVGPASNAIKDGHTVQITVEGKPAGEAALGKN
jgi:hypothetical protein